MFYITHENGVTCATRAPEGALMSPRYASDDFADAASFDTFGEASEVSQNFGPEWSVEDLGYDVRVEREQDEDGATLWAARIYRVAEGE